MTLYQIHPTPAGPLLSRNQRRLTSSKFKRLIAFTVETQDTVKFLRLYGIETTLPCISLQSILNFTAWYSS